MIISDRYRYVFVEIPLTGSWSIHEELCKHYGGQQVLHKHATYPQFLKIATPEQYNYFVFAAVRHPLDCIVSAYHKYRSDHKTAYSNSQASLANNQVDYVDIKIYNDVKEKQSDFATFYSHPRIWERPYISMIELSRKHLDFVIRYETLNRDFGHVLEQLQLTKVRDLPIRNATSGKRKLWQDYYCNDVLRSKAIRQCAPFMERWGYEFPAHWPVKKTPQWRKLDYQMALALKRLYLHNFRYAQGPVAQAVRRTHAIMRQRLL